uniref:Uncharacterized protein n=1 Tax=Globodera rostochiensis TaxID=31243 RepID=A0A914H186_GLORO
MFATTIPRRVTDPALKCLLTGDSSNGRFGEHHAPERDAADNEVRLNCDFSNRRNFSPNDDPILGLGELEAGQYRLVITVWPLPSQGQYRLVITVWPLPSQGHYRLRASTVSSLPSGHYRLRAITVSGPLPSQGHYRLRAITVSGPLPSSHYRFRNRC